MCKSHPTRERLRQSEPAAIGATEVNSLGAKLMGVTIVEKNWAKIVSILLQSRTSVVEP